MKVKVFLLSPWSSQPCLPGKNSRTASSGFLVYPGRENIPKSWLLFQLTFCFPNLLWVCRNCLLLIQQMQNASIPCMCDLFGVQGNYPGIKSISNKSSALCKSRTLIVIKVIKWINVSLYLLLLPTGKNSSYMSSRKEHELQKKLINEQQIITIHFRPRITSWFSSNLIQLIYVVWTDLEVTLREFWCSYGTCSKNKDIFNI